MPNCDENQKIDDRPVIDHIKGSNCDCSTNHQCVNRNDTYRGLPTTVRLVYPEDISVFYELYDCRLKIRKSFLTFFENLNTPMRIST